MTREDGSQVEGSQVEGTQVEGTRVEHRRGVPWKALLRWVAAGVLGYAVVVLLTTLGFVGWLGGAELYRGGALLQLQGMLVAVVSGLAGGCAAGWIGGDRPSLHALAVLPFIAADTSYVLFVLPRSAPVWFDLAGSLVLAAAAVAGGWMVGRGRG